MTIDNGFQRLARCAHRTHRELWIVLQHGADAGKDRTGARPPAVAIGARLRTGDPLARAVVEGGTAIETRGDFKAYPWQAVLDALDPAEVELARLRLAQ